MLRVTAALVRTYAGVAAVLYFRFKTLRGLSGCFAGTTFGPIFGESGRRQRAGRGPLVAHRSAGAFAELLEQLIVIWVVRIVPKVPANR